MKDTQHLNYVATLIVTDPEYDEMPPFATAASDMKREKSLGDVVPCSCADHLQASPAGRWRKSLLRKRGTGKGGTGKGPIRKGRPSC